MSTGPTDYPYVRAWGRLLGSSDWYVEQECLAARNAAVPPDAVYRRTWARNVSGWQTLAGLGDDARARVLAAVTP